MKILRGLAAIPAALVVLAGTALGGPAPVLAEQVLEGAFDYTPAEERSATWQIFPSCVPVDGDLREPLYLPVGCRLKIGPSEGDARLVGGMWTLTRPKLQGMQCADGSWAPTVEVVRFDDAAMTGTSSFSHSGACGTAPAIINTPFTLSYKGPLPILVDRYPLICEAVGGLRRCF